VQSSIDALKALAQHGAEQIPGPCRLTRAGLGQHLNTSLQPYGYRAMALRGGNETRVLSRNEKDFGSKFPEVKESIAALDVQDAIIDGEIVALDDKGRSSFQLLQAFDMGEKRPPIVFYAFDLLRLNGKDLQNLPIEERKAKLEALLKKAPGAIRYSVSFTKDIKELLARAQGLGLEGLIGKRSGSRYEAGKRCGAWVKIKLHLEQEFVIGGYTEPEGARKHFGALLVGVYEDKKLKFAGRVGTGFDDKLLRSPSLSMSSGAPRRDLYSRSCATTGTAWLRLVMNTKRPSAQPGQESGSGSEQSRLHCKKS
jgi:bifunctional non-homologous end joining protein LigD